MPMDIAEVSDLLNIVYSISTQHAPALANIRSEAMKQLREIDNSLAPKEEPWSPPAPPPDRPSPTGPAMTPSSKFGADELPEPEAPTPTNLDSTEVRRI